MHDISATEAYSTVITEDTELSNMTLIECARGCGRGCRFCIAGYVFRPPRYRPAADLLRIVEHSLEHTPRVGLLGAAVADHPDLAELVVGAHEMGARVSISSLRVDNLDPRVLDALSAGGTKTITVAPEAGSERMRAAINKGVTEEEILRVLPSSAKPARADSSFTSWSASPVRRTTTSTRWRRLATASRSASTPPATARAL